MLQDSTYMRLEDANLSSSEGKQISFHLVLGW